MTIGVIAFASAIAANTPFCSQLLVTPGVLYVATLIFPPFTFPTPMKATLIPRMVKIRGAHALV